MSEFEVALVTRLDYLISLVAFLPIALLLVKAIIRIFWGRL